MDTNEFETLEGNKKIDLFLGLPNIGLSSYHSDWNLLMVAIGTIEERYATKLISAIEWNGEKHISKYSFSISPDGTDTPIILKEGNDKIQLLWQAVVEFVEWSDQQKLKSGPLKT